ncbi:MAG: DUF5654 family protein [archaeon]|nr:DUF5654 family protein [archaeon]
MGSVVEEFKVQFLETVSTLVTAAFGLVAALAWNETIKTAIEQVFTTKEGIVGKFIYAFSVTIIAVVATLLVAHALAKAKGELKESQSKRLQE